MALMIVAVSIVAGQKLWVIWTTICCAFTRHFLFTGLE